MKTFNIPTRDEVTENNQAIFDNLKTNLGFVPNLYAYYAKNETALADYLALQNRKSTLSSKEQVLEIKGGRASFDNKLDSLAKFTLSVAENKGQVNNESKEDFFNAGYSESNMIDVVMVIGDKIISNYIHNLTGFEIDFPVAVELEGAVV